MKQLSTLWHKVEEYQGQIKILYMSAVLSLFVIQIYLLNRELMALSVSQNHFICI